ncbi:hypothetical protein [Methylotenera sp. L2L1]|uniref:hypothetical protein n=1 Tax=Methylotenera sp. L2L1 TaxID=1502770 RepID=UPI00055BA126|nr:hypothetical protein [Methylotenera sp. L2L1]
MMSNACMSLFSLFFMLMTSLAYASDEQGQTKNGEQQGRAVLVKSSVDELGYRVGDIARQSVEVITPKGYRLDETSIPALGKGAANIELRHANWEHRDFANNTHHFITLEWQVFRVMQEARYYALRPLHLQFKQEKKSISIDIKPAHVLISSVLPSQMNKDTMLLRTDIKPQLHDISIYLAMLALASFTFLLTLVYFTWHFDWFHLRVRKIQPFRRACREIKKLSNANSAQTANAFKAMRILRSAFDESAELTLTIERLSLLYQHCPWLISMQQNIEHFYLTSELAFFAGDQPKLSLIQLKKLSHQLMRLESI